MPQKSGGRKEIAKMFLYSLSKYGEQIEQLFELLIVLLS